VQTRTLATRIRPRRRLLLHMLSIQNEMGFQNVLTLPPLTGRPRWGHSLAPSPSSRPPTTTVPALGSRYPDPPNAATTNRFHSHLNRIPIVSICPDCITRRVLQYRHLSKSRDSPRRYMLLKQNCRQLLLPLQQLLTPLTTSSTLSTKHHSHFWFFFPSPLV